MAIYDYICTEGHVVELRRSYNEDVIKCPLCGHVAMRNPVNQSQTVITETGAKINRKVETPNDQVNLKKGFNLYREASQEVDYKYKKLSESTGREITPPLAKQAMAKARQLQKQGVTAEQFRKQRTS